MDVRIENINFILLFYTFGASEVFSVHLGPFWSSALFLDSSKLASDALLAYFALPLRVVRGPSGYTLGLPRVKLCSTIL